MLKHQLKLINCEKHSLHKMFYKKNVLSQEQKQRNTKFASICLHSDGYLKYLKGEAIQTMTGQSDGQMDILFCTLEHIMHQTARFTNHGNKMQQVHSGLVGLGVGQREERGQLKSNSITCIATL